MFSFLLLCIGNWNYFSVSAKKTQIVMPSSKPESNPDSWLVRSLGPGAVLRGSIYLLPSAEGVWGEQKISFQYKLNRFSHGGGADILSGSCKSLCRQPWRAHQRGSVPFSSAPDCGGGQRALQNHGEILLKKVKTHVFHTGLETITIPCSADVIRSGWPEDSLGQLMTEKRWWLLAVLLNFPWLSFDVLDT